jgi:hypothetical protein
MRQQNIPIILFCVLLCPLKIFGQERLTENKLIGLWKMNIDISKNHEQKPVSDKNILEDAITEGFIGFSKVLVENFDLRLNFKPGGKLETISKIGSEKPELNYGAWKIDQAGHLKINTDGEVVDSEEGEGCWVLNNGVLIKQNDDGPIHLAGRMTRIK